MFSPMGGAWPKAPLPRCGRAQPWSRPIWATMARRRPHVLSVDNLSSRYGRIEVLHGVSIDVCRGEIVTLVGANGAGKTTLLRAISGVQPITAGTIRFDGKPIERTPSDRRVTLGVVQVPEGRQLFGPLSV